MASGVTLCCGLIMVRGGDIPQVAVWYATTTSFWPLGPGGETKKDIADWMVRRVMPDHRGAAYIHTRLVTGTGDASIFD
jgi:hypothetical protein